MILNPKREIILIQCAKRSDATHMLAVGQTQTTVLNAGLERQRAH
jgi:nitrogenase subunit NifH